MSSGRRQMNLGLSMAGHGYHYSAWHHPGADPHGPTDFHYYLNLAKLAERGLFDMVFLADLLYFPMVNIPDGALGRRGDGVGLEPMTLLAALAPQTTHIGLVATTSTTFSQPYHLARSYASLDQLSAGRAGWNVVTSTDDDEAMNFGLSAIPEKKLRYQRAEEFLDVVTGLWDSFDMDTFSADRQTGMFFDPGKVRKLSYYGKYFSVSGPLNVRRSPQGRPVIVQAGASIDGQELAARTADVVYTLQNEIGRAKAFYDSVKARMVKYGREVNELKIMPGILPIIGETLGEAQAKHQSLQDLVDPMVGLEYLSGYFGDLSSYPIHGPVPDLRSDIPLASRGQSLLQIARRNNFSIHQLIQSVSISNGHKIVIGTPTMVADFMEEWFTAGAADGFNILPAVSPVSVCEFVDCVVPELQSRGIFRSAYPGTTLRENLDLPAVEPGTRLPPRSKL